MEASVNREIQRYIVSTWLSGDERGFDEDTDLQRSGILDSFSTLALVAFLDDAFRVRLEPPDINAESFRSVRAIGQLVAGRLASRTGAGAAG